VLNTIIELISLLTPAQRKSLGHLQALVICMALMEIAGIASIAPFMLLVGDLSLLDRENFFSSLFHQSGIQNPYDFVFLLGLGSLVLLTLASLISMFTIWKLSMFGAAVGKDISDRLFNHYMSQSWLFHANTSSDQLTKQISSESQRVSDGVIMPLMNLNAKFVFVLLISVAIFVYNPLIAIISLATFAVAYVLLFTLVRSRLQRNGKTVSNALGVRFRLMNEAFGGIKDVLLLDRKQYFIDRFEEAGEKLAYARGNNTSLRQIPRYFVELLAFGALISLVLYLHLSEQGNLAVILPILSVYALAAFKLLPAIQQIYALSSEIKGNLPAYESIRKDLIASIKQENKIKKSYMSRLDVHEEDHLVIKQGIQMNQVTFIYPGKTKPVLNSLNMTIPAKSLIGFVGPSGSGKSTIIDLLIGLIEPQDGQLMIDNAPIDKTNKRSWQNSIGFVAQSIFLLEGSIAENVAFGIPRDEINLNQLNKAICLAHLDELVQSLDEGVNTKIGERGVKLSGGQRQRIGIARALYHDADVLVFDEATSALDGITEKIIMDAIYDFSGQKTMIIIAHRLKTVRKCDRIFMIEQGEVTAQGTFEELLKTNEQFRKMENYA
jgi:HlyD family secretion protein